MHFLGRAAGLTLLAAGFVIVNALPATESYWPKARKEWRALTNQEKLNYIGAVKCLQNSLTPTTAGSFEGVRSRYDDFVAVHINNTDFVHFVGHFQPWHRFFVRQYEIALQTTCGYTGMQPYWDWTQDATEAGFPKSPLFDPTYGFGGNGPFINSTLDTSVGLHIVGKTGGGCVQDGPFKDYVVHMGPHHNTSFNPRCLLRDFAPPFAAANLNQGVVDNTLAAPNFAEFDKRVQGTITGTGYHGGGHLGTGGDYGIIGDVYASPSDPLFFMHHANLDRLWAKWQAADKTGARYYDIAGPDTQFAFPYNFFGDIPYKNVTLDFSMFFGGLVSGTPAVTIRSVMDVVRLGYIYV